MVAEVTFMAPKLSELEARALTREIQTTSAKLWDLVAQAYAGRAWEALGYAAGAKGWTAYCKKEFGEVHRNRLAPEVRREIVKAWLTDPEVSMSIPAAAAGLGVSVGTVHGDKETMKEAGELTELATVTDLNGHVRSRESKRVERPKLVIPAGSKKFEEAKLRVQFAGANGLTNVELAKQAGWLEEPGLASSYCSRMERRGLVIRAEDRRKGRVVYVWID